MGSKEALTSAKLSRFLFPVSGVCGVLEMQLDADEIPLKGAAGRAAA